jgi:hypothetical protein
MTISVTTDPKQYPLVCPPELLAGAETRINARPEFGYDWAIRFAAVPWREPRKAGRRPVDASERQARYYERRHQHAARRAW